MLQEVGKHFTRGIFSHIPHFDMGRCCNTPLKFKTVDSWRLTCAHRADVRSAGRLGIPASFTGF